MKRILNSTHAQGSRQGYEGGGDANDSYARSCNQLRVQKKSVLCLPGLTIRLRMKELSQFHKRLELSLTWIQHRFTIFSKHVVHRFGSTMSLLGPTTIRIH
jgi:hypothetical protein